MRPLRVAELFAGVGGFRKGLGEAARRPGVPAYEVTWSNQWEPTTRVQHASNVYVRTFGADGHTNVDVATVRVEDIPEVDLVVGGFPCQDYSVTTALQRAGGLTGKKGVLWWQIHRILRDKLPRPAYVLLENVDRLLKSPASQPGRDFAVMLASLSELGYCVEWRVVNAADYGMPQRRRRVFILAYLEGTSTHKALTSAPPVAWMTKDGVFARAFAVEAPEHAVPLEHEIPGDLVQVTQSFNRDDDAAIPFAGAGIMVGRSVTTADLTTAHTGQRMVLDDILVDETEVPSEFFIVDEAPWVYLKGAKSVLRKCRRSSHSYMYSEGSIAFPDPLDRPSRTIVTGEGGPGPSRFKHVIRTPSGKLRRLVPVELERLNMFPDGHTEGVPDGRRAFLMGNALVTGIVTMIGQALAERHIVKEPSLPRPRIRMQRWYEPSQSSHQSSDARPLSIE